MSVPLSELTDQPAVLELNLVELLPGWRSGMNAEKAKQRHVFAVPVMGQAPLVVFYQDVWAN